MKSIGNSLPKWAWLTAVVLVLIGVLRIVATYHQFSQAYDEPAHIACGMEWWDKGTFSMEPQHPPLPRLMVALGPYLSGLRLPEFRFADDNRAEGYDIFGMGNQILFARGQYARTLTLARIGTLPFFLITAFVTFFWARSLLGDWFAVLAVFLLTTLPTVLGYCSVAYVDPALLAFLPASLFAFIRWLETPSWGRSVLLGVALGGTLLSNTPWVVYMPPCVLAILACRWWGKRGQSTMASRLTMKAWAGHWLRPGALALLVLCFVVWAGYRFSVRPLDQVFEHPVQSAQRLKLPSQFKAVAVKIAVLNPRLPAAEFFEGIYKTVGENSRLYPSYMFGKVRRGGWWYFYFFMLAFKTPPGFQLLALIGTAWALMHFWNGKESNDKDLKNEDWRIAAPAVCVLVMLAMSTLVRVNLSVRHILFIYPPLAILAAFACREIWALRSRWPRFVPVVLGILVLGQGISTAWIHPNYMTYTSILAGRHPDEKLVLDADFDGGEYIFKLKQVLAEHNVDHLKLRLFTSADLTQMNLPPYEALAPYEHATGWIAISVYNLRLGGGAWHPDSRDGYAWLNAYQPVASVDKTIRLFYIAPAVDTGGAANPARR
jgi:Dolichyl-phosphate-mannose-protein mannosyltransferase